MNPPFFWMKPSFFIKFLNFVYRILEFLQQNEIKAH